jgi:antibiotic biosynthesis monooxygenase (ABM) superfamily enzyme
MKSSIRVKFAATPLAALCLAPLSCLAQGNQGNLFELVDVVVKPGMTAKFEEGIKQVNAYARSHGDTTGTGVFQVMYGPEEGNIDVLIPFRWENEDNPPSYEAGLQQAIAKNLEPYLSSAHTQLVRELPNLGNHPAANAAPQKYYEVISVRVKPGRMDDFLAAVGQLSTAEQKFNPGPNPVLIYTTVAGGDANEVVVAIGHPTFADFARQGKSNTEVLTAAYGAPAARAVVNSLDNTIATEQVTIVRYRPELSFAPNGQGQ